MSYGEIEVEQKVNSLLRYFQHACQATGIIVNYEAIHHRNCSFESP